MSFKPKLVKKLYANLKAGFALPSVHSIFCRILALWFFSALSVCGQTWNSTGTGDWFTASNWTPANVPTNGSTVTIDNGGTATISTSAAVSGATYIGETGTGNLTIYNGGKLNSGNSGTEIGKGVGSIGSVLVDGSGSSWTTNDFDPCYVGESGKGNLTIQNGATVSIESELDLGLSTGSTGILTVNGTNSALLFTGNYPTLGVGTTETSTPSDTNYGSATVTIENGGYVSDYIGAVGHNGTVILTGANSSWHNSDNLSEYSSGNIQMMNGASIQSDGGSIDGNLTVDNSSFTSGTCTFSGIATVQNGGTITNNFGGDLEGTLTVTGANSAWNNPNSTLYLGDFGLGFLSILQGGTVSDFIGDFEQGAVTVDGPNSLWTNSSYMNVGQSETDIGPPTFNIQNGATVSATDTYFWVGSTTVSGANTNWNAGTNLCLGYDQSSLTTGAHLLIETGGQVNDSNGYVGDGVLATAIVDGGGTAWNNALTLAVGCGISTQTGILTIQEGGTVGVASGAGTIIVNSYGTLQIGNGNPSGIANAATINLGASSSLLVFDHDSFPDLFTSAIIGIGPILHEGSGTTILSGNTSGFSGPVTITNGALLVKNSLGYSRSTVTVSNGTLGGSGTIISPVTLNTGGILSPGGDGGNSHLTANYVTWNGGGGMAFNLGTSSAQLTVPGTLTKGSDGTYNIDFENGGGIAVGTYTIITFGSTTFSASDFTYTSSLAGFSGSFSISGNSLKFTVLTLSPVVAPKITSASSTTFTASQANSFTVTGTGNSAPTFSATGLPSWASLNPKTGVLSGTPPNATGSPFTITLTATNGATPNATQTFTLAVAQAPVITSAASTTFTATQSGSFTVTATGTPAPTYTATGLPTWATLNATTGVLSGTPPGTTSSPFTITFTASNGITPSSTQTFTLTVQPLEIPPTITGTSSATFAVGQLGTYVVTATGNPAPTFSAIGLPGWASLNSVTGLLSGTPPSTAGSPISITLTASNGVSPNATQGFTLKVNPAVNFSLWESNNSFVGSASIIGPTAAPENDGIPNLLKYLFDINPSAPMSATDRAALPTVGVDTTTTPGMEYLMLTYRQYASASGITVNFQTSPDLKTWTTVTPDLSQQIGTVANTGDPIMEMGVIATGAPQFIRLNVTQP